MSTSTPSHLHGKGKTSDMNKLKQGLHGDADFASFDGSPKPSGRVTRSQTTVSSKDSIKRKDRGNAADSKAKRRRVSRKQEGEKVARPRKVNAPMPLLKVGQFYLQPSQHFKQRVSCHTNCDIVNTLKTYLTPKQLDMFRSSCFGYFLDLPPITVHNQLIHALLQREVVPKGKDELCIKINDCSLRFGLGQFALVTGLKVFEDVDKVFEKPKVSRLLEEYFEGSTSVTKKQLFTRFKDSQGFQSDEDAFHMALMVFIHTFLFSNANAHIIKKCDFDVVESGEYETYPWGLDVFSKTFQSCHDKQRDPPTMYTLLGMPLAIQTWFFECCSKVDEQLAIRVDSKVRRILNWSVIPGFLRYSDFTQGATMTSIDRLNYENIFPTSEESSTLMLGDLFGDSDATSEKVADQVDPPQVSVGAKISDPQPSTTKQQPQPSHGGVFPPKQQRSTSNVDLVEEVKILREGLDNLTKKVTDMDAFVVASFNKVFELLGAKVHAEKYSEENVNAEKSSDGKINAEKSNTDEMHKSGMEEEVEHEEDSRTEKTVNFSFFHPTADFVDVETPVADHKQSETNEDAGVENACKWAASSFSDAELMLMNMSQLVVYSGDGNRVQTSEPNTTIPEYQQERSPPEQLFDALPIQAVRMQHEQPPTVHLQELPVLRNQPSVVKEKGKAEAKEVPKGKAKPVELEGKGVVKGKEKIIQVGEEDVTPKVARVKFASQAISTPYTRDFQSGSGPPPPKPIHDTKHPFSSSVVEYNPLASLSMKFYSFVDEDLQDNPKRKNIYPKGKDILPVPFIFGRCDVTRKEWFHSIAYGGRLLSSTHMDVIFYYLRKKGKYGPNNHVKFTTTDWSFNNKIIEYFGKYENDLQKIPKENILEEYVLGGVCDASTAWKSVDHVLFPIFIKDSNRRTNVGHWVLGVLTFRDRCIYVYDSNRGAKNDSAVREVLKSYAFVLPYLLINTGFWLDNPHLLKGDAYIGKDWADQFNIKWVDNVPQQQEADCGAFCAGFAEYFIEGKEFKENDEELILNIRGRLATCLWDYGKKKQEAGAISDDEEPPKLFKKKGGRPKK